MDVVTVDFGSNQQVLMAFRALHPG